MFKKQVRNHLFVLPVLALVLSLASPAWSQEALGSRVNGLMVVDVSDHYITPRGLNVEDKGVVTQPLMLMMWNLHGADKGPLRDVTLTTGVWNSFHSRRSGLRPSNWNELDPILGMTFKFQGGWTVDAFTTSFYTPTDSYPTSTHLDLKLTYNDTFKETVSLNPYFAVWKELNNKATVAFDPSKAKEGSYITLGATPTIKLGAGGSKLEVGAYANLVSSTFYQKFDGSPGGSGMAVVSVYPKLSVPLKFMGVSHGAWTGYVGVNYFHLRNEGLLDGNQVLASPDRKSNLGRVRAGVTIFF